MEAHPRIHERETAILVARIISAVRTLAGVEVVLYEDDAGVVSLCRADNLQVSFQLGKVDHAILSAELVIMPLTK